VLALVAFAALVVGLLTLGTRSAVRRLAVGEVVSHALVATTEKTGRTARRLGGLRLRQRTSRLVSGQRLRQRTTGLVSGLRRRSRRAPARASTLITAALQAYARAYYRLNLRNRIDGRRRAIQLNERGAQLRRQGDPLHAAEQHRVALEIVRELGDEQAEALTLNSLGLALAQVGAEGEAVEYLEQARDVLHALGDEEHEGQVIANLGIVYRRQGDGEQAIQFLHQALDKLPPESPTYRKVEAELLRAS
jgi:tetratricopeptide (TPR) repeat protein